MEDELNAEYVKKTQNEYLEMRMKTYTEGELASNRGYLRRNDGNRRKQTLKEQQQQQKQKRI